MMYGYYLTLGNQLAETRDHVNLLWLDDRHHSPDDLAELTQQGKTCVLDVAGCLFDGRALRPDAEQRLKMLRQYILMHGDLFAVEVIVPCDEPNLPETDVAHLLPEAVAIIRRAWPGAMVGCVYFNDGEFPHHHLFDVLGFDDYWGGYGIFERPRWYERIKLFFGGRVRRGSYLRFAEMLRADQKTWLLPGGAKARDVFEEPPERWMAFAKSRPEVWAVVPFLWASAVDGDNAITGIRDLPLRAAYERAGAACVGRQT